MSKEKYTIEQEPIGGGGVFDDGFIVLKDNEFFCEANTLENAELICRLLNENENLVLVDKEVKEEWLDLIKAQYEEYCHFTLKEGVKEKEENAIKAIESLPTEEN